MHSLTPYSIQENTTIWFKQSDIDVLFMFLCDPSCSKSYLPVIGQSQTHGSLILLTHKHEKTFRSGVMFQEKHAAGLKPDGSISNVCESRTSLCSFMLSNSGYLKRSDKSLHASV